MKLYETPELLAWTLAVVPTSIIIALAAAIIIIGLTPVKSARKQGEK